MDRPRIILLPGLGADQRLLEAQRAIHADIEVPPWIAPEPRESLAAYARRLVGMNRAIVQWIAGAGEPQTDRRSD